MPTKKRSKQRVAVAALAALVALNLIVMVAFTRSTNVKPPGGQVAGELGVPPEIEAGEYIPGRVTPDEFLDLKQSSNSEVTEAQVLRAQKQADAVAVAAPGIAWQQLGPYNIGGRVTDVVADRFHPNTAFAALAGGGVWRTTDGGTNWDPVWPDDFTQPMGSLAQGKDGVLWAGTGEANPPGGGLTYFGDGVYKSTDDGAHWTNMGLEHSSSIGRIAIDPTNQDRVFFAASGHIARSAAQRGLYRTTDGGKTIKLVLAPPNSSTGAIDVVINPANPSIVYASLWDHRRTNGRRIYGGVGSGLFRSKDGGDTWERLENIVGGLATYDQTQTGLTSHESLGRIGIAVAPSNPNRVYIVFGNQTGPDKGFYASNDGGDSFACPRPAAGGACGRAYAASGGFQWWFGRIYVDPDDQNHIFNTDVSLRASTDGGITWSANSGGLVGGGSVHADQHGMDWDPSKLDGNPATPNRVFLGNDAGIYRSENSGFTGSWIKAQDQPWNQSYHLTVSPQDSTRMTTGLQDNGSVRTWSPTTPSPTDPILANWNSFGGGDGHYNVIDPTDKTWYYACSQASGAGRHSCSRYHDLATTTQSASITQAGFPANQRYTTDAPIVIDPNVPPLAADGTQPPNAIYIGGATIGRSQDRGVTPFTMISPVMAPGTPAADDPRLPGPVLPEEEDTGLYGNLYGAVTTVAPAKSQTPVPYASTLYAGTDTGLVWKTTNAGANWTQMQGLPKRWVNMIIVDPGNENHVFIAFSGFRQGDDAANVWETTNGGTTWQNISQNMPNGPVEMIEYDAAHDVLFAATDVGVFDHKDGDSAWYKISVGMPQVPVLDVKLSGDGKFIFAATFGRSVFKLPLSTDATDGGGAGTGGTVPATLGLTLGTPGAFGAFTPGVSRDYSASTTANVISTAGDGTLSVADPSSNATGHLVNGTFSLPSALQVKAASPLGTGGAFGPVGGSAAPSTLLTYAGPVSNDPVTVSFSQHISASDALRTGAYSKTLTFTLSTANP